MADTAIDEQTAAEEHRHVVLRRRARLLTIVFVVLALLGIAIVSWITTEYPRTDDAEVFANFIGMAPAVLQDSMHWTAVELDHISASIARVLYPGAKVINNALEDVVVPGASADLAIGNPPFGNVVIHDNEHRDLAGFTLHNFMFAKSLKALVPGGLLAMVVSSSLIGMRRSSKTGPVSMPASSSMIETPAS